MDKLVVQAHIIFSGTVQGVGFRYTVQRYALSLELTGWVKNRSNGFVEILVEGPKEKIEKLCQNIEEYFGEYIENKDIQYTKARGKIEKFQITY